MILPANNLTNALLGALVISVNESTSEEQLEANYLKALTTLNRFRSNGTIYEDDYSYYLDEFNMAKLTCTLKLEASADSFYQ